MSFIKGFLSRYECKDGRQLDKWLGDISSNGVQYLLDLARWDTDSVRDTLRR